MALGREISTAGITQELFFSLVLLMEVLGEMLYLVKYF